MKSKSTGWVTGKKGEKSIVVLDYDNMGLEEVKKDIKELQDKFSLGNATVSKSSEKSYHVYFFNDRFGWEDFKAILKESKCDKKFKDFKSRVNFSRMRIGKKKGSKPEVVCEVKSKYNKKDNAGQLQKRMYERVVG